jgi:hypothetical protein
MKLKERAVGIVEQFKGQKILISSTANFFGQKSKGIWQVRGVSQVVLLPNELYSEMIYPKRILRIPIIAIREVDITKRSFLRKTRFKKLLIIHFLNESGEEDSAGWLIPHLESYKRLIDELRMGRTS